MPSCYLVVNRLNGCRLLYVSPKTTPTVLDKNSTISSKVFAVFKRDIIIYVSSLFTSTVVARRLGPDVLGLWTILSLISAYGEAFGRTKADVASVYIIGNKNFSQNEVISNLNLITLVGFVLFIIAFYFCSNFVYFWLFQNVETSYTSEVYFLILHLFFYFFYLNYLYFFLAIDDIGVHNKMVLIRTWTLTLLSILLVVFTELGVMALVISTLVSTVVALFFGVRSSNLKVFNFDYFELNLIKQLLWNAKSIYLSGILGQLQQSSVRLLSANYLLPSSIAFLGLAETISAMINKIVEPVNSIMYPEISRTGSLSAVERSLTSFRLLSIILSFSVALIYLVIGSMIKVFYGNSFLIVSNLVYVLLPGLFINGIGGIFLNFFNGTGNSGVIPRIMIVPLGIQILLAIIFIPIFGLIGAAFVVSAGLALNGIASIYYFKVITRCSSADFIPKYSDFFVLFQILLRFLR